MSFVNPIAEGAHPRVVRDGDRYLWCLSEGERGIVVWESDRLTSLGARHVVWTAPASGPMSRSVRSPQLTRLDGRWFIYFSAGDGDERSLRAYVLAAGGDGSDPLGDYEVHGPLATGELVEGWPRDLWATDLTVLRHDAWMFAVWSGWPGPRNDVQHLYIAPMLSPTELSAERVRICAPDDYPWELTENTPRGKGVNEAPQVLSRGGRTFLVYSCGSSWLPSYNLGMLELVGADPLDPACWSKLPTPVFGPTSETFGVGHSCFVRSRDGSQWWHVYDAKWDKEPGWRRVIFLQPLQWDADGAPVFGDPLDGGVPVDVPAVTPSREVVDARFWNLSQAAAVSDFDYYGHHQFVERSGEGLDLGVQPGNPVNAFRSGEKVVLRDGAYGDVRLTASFAFVEGDRDVGVLFRVSEPSVGFDAQRGYFAAVSPSRGGVLLGKMDGLRWSELGFAAVDVDLTEPQRLVVQAVGDKFSVSTGPGEEPLIVARDRDYPAGSIGCRVVDTHARFTSLDVEPLR